jgi:hypothetical protein
MLSGDWGELGSLARMSLVAGWLGVTAKKADYNLASTHAFLCHRKSFVDSSARAGRIASIDKFTLLHMIQRTATTNSQVGISMYVDNNETNGEDQSEQNRDKDVFRPGFFKQSPKIGVL